MTTIFAPVFFCQKPNIPICNPLKWYRWCLYCLVLRMEEIEKTAIASTPIPPKIWKRYVDDSFCIIKKNAVTSFHNSLTHTFPSPSNTNLMASCHSSTPLFLARMRGSTLMYIGSPHTWTDILISVHIVTESTKSTLLKTTKLRSWKSL